MKKISEQNCKTKDLYGCKECTNHVVRIDTEGGVTYFCDEKNPTPLIRWNSEE